MIIATHSGPFHADDVFAGALLLHFYPDAEVVRSRDPEVLSSADIVYDVGSSYDVEAQRFDHHMSDFDEKRDNGVVLSSFGLLWREYGLRYCDDDQELADKIESSIIDPIDAVDNGQEIYEVTDMDVHPFTINTVVHAYRPADNEDQDFDAGYMKAVELASYLLERVKIRARAKLLAEREARAVMDSAPNDQYVVFEKHMPYSSITDDYPSSLYCIFPGAGDEWIVRAAPLEKGSNDLRKPLPEAWCGLEDQALEEASGIDGAKFCHRGAWIAGAYTKEAAISMVNAAISD